MVANADCDDQRSVFVQLDIGGHVGHVVVVLIFSRLQENEEGVTGVALVLGYVGQRQLCLWVTINELNKP